ncbi:MAG: 1-acyl-sn-glycerol-3-phosphate acyltransferase [Proteobacteria bacterium]|nr:1-acyl-sn-glycerol-3-phosphate acyltransferase [Pseudomonadota bacterium]
MPLKLLSILRSVPRLILLFLWLILVLPLQIFITLFPSQHPFRQKIVQMIFKGTCWTLGLKVRLKGEKLCKAPCLFLSNHISYLDILALGASVKASFISKEDVRKWPIFGLYAQLQGAIFIKRTKTTLLTQKSVILERLQGGNSLILFPEGTTHNGIHVLPIKSSLLESIEHDTLFSNLKIQPLSLTYTSLCGLTLSRKERLQYSWFGDLSLLPHIYSILTKGPLLIEITAHAPLTAHKDLNRKKAASYCHDSISQGISKTFQAPSL